MLSFTKFRATHRFTDDANKISLYFLLSLISVVLTCFISAAQTQVKKALSPNLYRNFVKPGTVAKIQTIENGRVRETDTTALTNLMIPANKKSVISNETKISVIDAQSYQKLQAGSGLTYSREDIQTLPELHVEAGSMLTEDLAYRIVFTLQQPLSYNDTLKKFNARLGFFLLRESGNNSGNNSGITEPVNIEVVSNEVTSIRPEHLQISHLNLPSTNVELVADQVNDSAAVKVITTSNPQGYTTYLKVKPKLLITTNRTGLQGYGIQEIPVSVMFVGSSSPDSVKVNFSVEKGTVSPASMYVKYNQAATVYLRSEGTGTITLSAISNNIKSNDLDFRYVFPWVFLLASILGGLVGSLAKYYFTANARKKKFPLKPIIGGILIGLIGAVVYYGLGVNLLGIQLSAGMNELAVFGLSALCAYFGISLLKLDGKQ